jgi:hypothetical protein
MFERKDIPEGETGLEISGAAAQQKGTITTAGAIATSSHGASRFDAGFIRGPDG